MSSLSCLVENFETRKLLSAASAQNAAPALANIETSVLPYAPDAAPTVITTTLTVSDADNANLTGATVVISAGFQAGDVLSFTDTANITGVFSAGTLTLTGTDTTANYEAALHSVTYSSSSGDPATRTVSFQVNDGSGLNNLSNVATRMVGGTAQLVGSTLNVYGTSVDNIISLTKPGTLDVNVDNVVTSFSSASVTAINVFGFDGNDTITLSSAISQTATLSGGNGNDTLTGGSGSDILDGGAGNDSLIGGLGNDTYVFSTATSAEADVVTENSNQGSDTLSFVGLTTPVSLNLGFSSAQPVHVNRTLQLSSTVVIENLIGGSGNDALTGNLLPNVLTGNAGNDRLNGAFGSDSLIGGLGDDTYVFSTATSAEADVVTEFSNQGSDTLSFLGLTTPVSLNLGFSSAQPVHVNRTLQLSSTVVIENLIGGSGNDILTGNLLPNVLTGNSGDDILNGASGSDSLIGGLGNDTYIFKTSTSAEADVVTEFSNQGTDTLNFSGLTTAVSLNLGFASAQPVHANRTLQLSSTSAFENLIGGSGNDLLSGNTLANVLTGNAGSDILIGASGSDSLIGGLGNDTYVFKTAISAEADVVTEFANQGTDTLRFSDLTTAVSLNLGTSVVQNVHINRTLELSSSASFENITGGLANDTLSGNSADNLLNGGSGADVLVGKSGNDTLNGQAGRDILIGGLGLDTIDGGSADDILIAGRTTNDTNIAALDAFRAEWISGGTYADRIANLRSGVGSPTVSLKAQINVLNDAGEDDLLTGGSETDWYFKAVDDVITDLFGGEIIDAL